MAFFFSWAFTIPSPVFSRRACWSFRNARASNVLTEFMLMPNCSAISRYFSDSILSNSTSSSRGERTDKRPRMSMRPGRSFSAIPTISDSSGGSQAVRSFICLFIARRSTHIVQAFGCSFFCRPLELDKAAGTCLAPDLQQVHNSRLSGVHIGRATCTSDRRAPLPRRLHHFRSRPPPADKK